MNERIETAKALWNKLSPDEKTELFAYFETQGEGEYSFDAELDRRADEIRNGTAKGRPVEDVMRDLSEVSREAKP